MLSVDGFVGVDRYPKKEENLKEVFTAILQTVVLLGKPHGMNYVAKIVAGDEKNFWKDEAHLKLETFGKGRGRDNDSVAYVMHLMIDRRLLEIKLPQCSTISITELGKAWLQAPSDVIVWNSESRFDNLEGLLRRKLRGLRYEIAAKRGVGAWEVFTDYTLDRIVLEKPTGLDRLKSVAGVGMARAESFGTRILNAVHEIMGNFFEVQCASWRNMLKGPQQQRIKALFLEDVTIPEIAFMMGFKITTVSYYLRVMHVVNEVDLIPWIKKNINPHKLYQAVEYFEKVQGANVQEAYNTLDMDWDTLLFCHLYAVEINRQDQEVRLSA